MKLRKIVSLTALLSFVLLLLSSVVLYISPSGRIANWVNWRVLGLDHHQWGDLHTNLGLLFTVVCLIHTVINWKCIVVYLRNKACQLRIFTGDFMVAILITFLVVLLTVLHLPPLNGVQKLNDKIQKSSVDRYGIPPYGQAQGATLKSFCLRTRINLDEAIQKLNAADLKGVTEEVTLLEIADANHITPQKVYDLMRSTPLP